MSSGINWTRDYFYETENNQLIGHVDEQTDYTYDAHGNMLTMPHLSAIEWDYANRMKKTVRGTTTTYYCYDINGVRTRKVNEKQGGIKEVRSYLDGYEVFRKYISGDLDLERQTLHIDDDNKKVALVETLTVVDGDEVTSPSPVIRYQYDNHLGSACLELDDSAAIISYEEYHPFGTTSYRSGSSSAEVSLKRYKYVGKERDEETGLYYYGARYYAAWLCRFVSVDPLQHKYPYYTPFQYAGNKPISYIDLDGLEENNPNKVDFNKDGYYNDINKFKNSELGFFIGNPIIASQIGQVSKGSTNISTNSVRFATRIGLLENSFHEGSQVNAFRHALWQATITTKFGANIAEKVGLAHEENFFIDISIRSFSGKNAMNLADQTIDILNNEIGVKIGLDNPNASPQELAIKTLETFRNEGLYTATTLRGGDVVITKTKITEKQYITGLETLKKLNNYGFTKVEQLQIDEKKQKEIEKNQNQFSFPK